MCAICFHIKKKQTAILPFIKRVQFCCQLDTAHQTEEPRQCSFCRIVSKKEVSPKWSRFTLRRLRRIVTASPAPRLKQCPSAAMIVSIPLLANSAG